MIRTWAFRVVGGAAVVWLLVLLGSSPVLELDAGLDPPVPATVHCDAVLQSGDAVAFVGRDGEVGNPRWSLDDDDRTVIERRLTDQRGPVEVADGIVDPRPEVTLDEAAISASCDARRSYRIGWSVLLLGLALVAFRLGRPVAGTDRATAA